MASRLAGIAILLGVLGLGIFIGYGFSLFVDFNRLMIDPEVEFYANKVRVEVVDLNVAFTFSLDDPCTKVLFYQEGGYALGVVVRRRVDWQVVLGQEDWPYEGKGDSCDVILKIRKVADTGQIEFEVACLGAYTKRVYYEGQLKLDTSTGQYYATWTVNS